MINRVLMRIVFGHDSCEGEAMYLGKNYHFSYNSNQGYAGDKMPNRVFNAITREVSTLHVTDIQKYYERLEL